MSKPAPDPTPHFKIECPCGWREVFTRGYSGLEIECARCGATHRIPMVPQDGADSSAEALQVMRQFLDTRPYGQPGAAPAPQATVRLKPLFALSAVTLALAAVGAALFFHDKPWPMAVVIVGGAASWPLGLFVAWLGQRAGRKNRGAS